MALDSVGHASVASADGDPDRNGAVWVYVDSSNVFAVCWYIHPTTRHGMLGVRYGGQPPQHAWITTYDYIDVPPDVFDQIIASASKGKAVNRLVKKPGYKFIGPT